QTDGTFAFTALPNGDLMAIKKSGTGSGSTEVHILSAASNYSKFRLQTGTALHQTDGTFVFAALANGDLMAIKKSGTGTGSTEVHILSAGTNYSRFSLQAGTGLHETDNTFDFASRNGRELIAIKKSATGSGKTELHILMRTS
ncbi:MAG: VCBS repeat-containing protein, partial [Cyanobacteriota bacterium]